MNCWKESEKGSTTLEKIEFFKKLKQMLYDTTILFLGKYLKELKNIFLKVLVQECSWQHYS